MDEWYTAQQLAGVTGMPANARNIVLKAKNNEWQTRKKLKGKGFEYHITSLPEETKTALTIANGRESLESKDKDVDTITSGPTNNIETPRQNTLPGPDVLFNYDKEALWQHYDNKSDSIKAEANKRLHAINTALSLIANQVGMIKAWKAAAESHQVHYYTLRYRWYESVKQYNRSDWLAVLVPGYTGRTVTAECDEAALSFFKADYLRLEQPTAAACYRRLQRAADEHGWQIPSCDSLVRRIKRDVPKTIRVLKREGEQKLYQLYPPQKRSVRDLYALQAVNGDGYEHNVFIKWPDGTITRPKTWFWQDIYSRKILAWRVDTTENTDTIRLSFGDLVEQYGIPEHATIDNTRAAANKWMTGGIPNRYRFKVKEDDPLGLFPTLGIQVHWTSVFNGKGSGQSKPVERAFGVGGIGEMVDKHPALAGCYTGANPTAKPENYGSRAISLDDFLLVLEQEVLAFNSQLKRRTEMCGGIHSFDQVFTESYRRSAITKPTDAQRRLWLLSAEAVKVQKNGTITLDAGSAVGVGRNRYRADALYDLEGQKVVVRFDPQSLHKEVFIYDLKGVFLDKAICIEDAGFMDTQAAREHSRARKHFIRSTKDAAKMHDRMTAIEAAGFLPQQDKPSIPDVKVVRPFKPVTERKANATPVVSVEERERLANEIANRKADVIETPRQKYFRWCDIDNTPAGDRTLEDQQFYDSFQKTPEFRAEKMICEEFGLSANGG